MDKLTVCVFSGTGNTLKCAEFLREELAAYHVESDLVMIGEGRVPEDCSLLVICYPVHGFNAPYPVIRFLKDLPKGKGRVWFLKTSGEPSQLNDNSSSRLIAIAREKCLSVRGELHVIMPYNMIFRHSDEMASLMWQEAKERIRNYAADIITGKRRKSKPSPSVSSKIMSVICRIEHPFYPVNGRLFRVDRKKCIGCQKCVRECPSGNIKMENGKIKFGGHCCECARCSFNCPADAIHIGLLDFMRVNGPYDFDSDPSGARIGRFCRKSYKKYFRK